MASISTPEAIVETLAKYYRPVVKKWDRGIFMLFPHYLSFIDEENGDVITLPLFTISTVKKKKCFSICSGAIVVEVVSNKHWFAAFYNRNRVFNLIELFWRAALLQIQRNVSINLISPPVASEAKKILELVRESEETLVGTANALERQSHQLAEVQETVEELKSDLKLNENTSPLSSDDDDNAEPHQYGTSPVQEQKNTYKVMFERLNKSSLSASEWENGFLYILDTLQLMDKNKKLKHCIAADECKLITVVAPWEMCVCQVDSAHVEYKYNVICPIMPRLLKILKRNASFHDKINDISTNHRWLKVSKLPVVIGSRSKHTSYSPSSPSGSSTDLGASQKLGAQVYPKETLTSTRQETDPPDIDMFTTIPGTVFLRDSTRNKDSALNTEQPLQISGLSLHQNIRISQDSTENIDMISITDEEETNIISLAVTNLKTLATTINREQNLQAEVVKELAIDLENAELKLKSEINKT